MDASQLQDCGGEVHDGVDAGKLLQDLQAHTCSSSPALLCESMSNTVWGSLHLTQWYPASIPPIPVNTQMTVRCSRRLQTLCLSLDHSPKNPNLPSQWPLHCLQSPIHTGV